MEKLVILGTGCAGYSAAIYAARAGLSPLILSGPEPGGQLTETTIIENYPGFPNGIDGNKLMDDMKTQAMRFGAMIHPITAEKIKILKDGFEIVTNKSTIETSSIIIATGSSARWLNVPGEKKFKGKGVHVCATCDGYFYKDKEVIVVGGGDSACEEALFLSKVAKKVTIVHRKNELKAGKVLQEKVKKTPNISIMWNSEVDEIKGEQFVKSVVLLDTISKRKKEVSIDGIFVAIGHEPNTAAFKDIVKTDKNGVIIADRYTHTNVPGIFAAGDVQDPRFRQAITAAGSGAMAAIEARNYLQEKNK